MTNVQAIVDQYKIPTFSFAPNGFGEYLRTSPESAGWEFLNLSARIMKQDEKWTFQTEENELALVVLINNHGFSSIGGLSEAIGSGGFTTRYLYSNPESDQIDGETHPVDFAANTRSLVAHVIEAADLNLFKTVLEEAKS